MTFSGDPPAWKYLDQVTDTLLHPLHGDRHRDSDSREVGEAEDGSLRCLQCGGPRDAIHSHVTWPLLVPVLLRAATPRPTPRALTRLFSVLKMEGSMM